MKKKILISFTLCLAVLTDVFGQSITDSVMITSDKDVQAASVQLKPTYLKNVWEAADWGRNWFIEVKGGASAFLGTPIGCGDVFDRITPVLQIGVGKWFTPAIGGRIGFQGLTFKNAEFKTMDYQFVHADFMYNVTSFLGQNDLGISKWDIIPYIGVGMIHNSDWPSCCECLDRTSGSHPFAFSYGLEARYRLNNRMHIIAEISGMTTSKKFDGIGESTRFGDHMFNLSAGLSFTFGKPGFKRVSDTNPSIIQKDLTCRQTSRLKDADSKDSISKCCSRLERHQYPHNNYSGLNSLRARLNKPNCSGDSICTPDSTGYGQKVNNTAICAPIFFFFRIGTTTFTEKSQQLNIDEIAKVAKQYGLKVKITGAADSATGNKSINESLSNQRAEYIKKLMLERGIAEDRITTEHKGGIDAYSPTEANRNTHVVLSY